MADAPAVRDVIHKRLLHIASVYGSANVRQIEGVLAQVWARRDSSHDMILWSGQVMTTILLYLGPADNVRRPVSFRRFMYAALA